MVCVVVLLAVPLDVPLSWSSLLLTDELEGAMRFHQLLFTTLLACTQRAR